jgi:hypothetical protein
MTPVETTRLVLRSLDEAGIPHMLVGSFASSEWGRPRTTHDVDLIIDPTHESLTRFEELIAETELYLGPDPHEALDRSDQFNVIDASAGWKIDLMIRPDTPFQRNRFSRRVEGLLMDIPVWISTAEDTVLAKLLWAQMGGSERQLEDVAGVLDVQAEVIDNDYLDRWALELGVTDLLEQVRASNAG